VSSLAEPLFFFDGSEVEAARAARERGERVVAFSESAARRLADASIPFLRSVDALGDDPEMPLYRAAADWTQGFGTKAVDARGQTLKDALRYRDTTLWWWAELYLHHNTEAVRRVRFLETVARAVEAWPTSAIRRNHVDRAILRGSWSGLQAGRGTKSRFFARTVGAHRGPAGSVEGRGHGHKERGREG